MLGFLILSLTPVLAQNDTITFGNGDKLIGEIKSMDKGVLIMKTDYSDDDFTIEWNKITSINTQSKFVISLSNGQRVNSVIKSDKNIPNIVILVSYNKVVLSQLGDIVFIQSYGEGFINRLSASIDFGYNLTKANSMKQFTANGKLGFQTNLYSIDAMFEVINNAQDEVDDIYRSDTKIGFNYYLPKDMFLTTTADFLQNDELKLNLRSNISAGLGYFINHTNVSFLALGTGLAYNNETYTKDADTEDRNSVEIYMGIIWNIFDVGDINAYTKIMVYPNLTLKNRIRSDIKFDLKYDLKYDFYVRLGTTINYDNQPADGAEKLDYIMQTAFGWEL